jgi:hypothetical protein
MKKYKLTTQEMTTYNGFKWELGKKYTTSGEGDLCSGGFLHYYHHPLLAVLLNPIHADITNPRIFEVEADGIHKNDNGLKGGCNEMTLVKEIELPIITSTQRVAFSILASLDVYKNEGYEVWAKKWLSGEDRSAESARSAAESAWSAARSAARSAWSAESAESAAWSAESAESAAWSAESAESAESAAWSAAWSAESAESAAWSAARSARSADEILNKLIQCAEKCLEY